jgi:hypothetical protein
LKALEPIHSRSQEVGNRLNSSLHALDGSDMSTLDTAADDADAAIKEYEQEQQTLEATTPPPGLEDAHQRLLKGLEGQMSALRQISKDLRGHDIAAIQGWKTSVTPALETARTDIQAWRTAVIDFGTQHDVTVPAWVNSVGTSG